MPQNKGKIKKLEIETEVSNILQLVEKDFFKAIINVLKIKE